MEAYARSKRLFEWLAALFGPLIGVELEKHILTAGGETLTGYAIFPKTTTGPIPLIVATNGLEGTSEEIAVPLLRFRHSPAAMFIMEMPGTYVYRDRMSPGSEAVYEDVFAYVGADPRVDASRVGFLGLSFGAYWVVRMAAKSRRLRCAAANGAPADRTYSISGSFGIPEVIVKCLKYTTGARTLLGLIFKLRALALGGLPKRIQIPLLVINGDSDTLVSTQDSIDIANAAPHATLRLYADDDHCAMNHYDDWLELSHSWLVRELA